MATLENNTIDAAATRFREVIVDWLGHETCGEVDTRNKSYPESVCATHDFCDANMAMFEALTDLGHEVFNDEGLSEDVTDLWNAAWTRAKEKGFSGAA